MAFYTLSELRTDARRAADMEGHTNFVTNAEVDRYINLEIAQLHELLVKADSDAAVALGTLSVTATSATARATLPDNFRRMKQVWEVRGSDYVPVRRGKSHDLFDGRIDTDSMPYYKVFWNYTPGVLATLGPQIMLYPVKDYSLQLLYIPQPPTLVADADEFMYPHEYADYVIAGAAIRCLEKEQNDTSSLMERKKKVELEILTSAFIGDATQPDTITDLDEAFDFPYWSRNS